MRAYASKNYVTACKDVRPVSSKPRTTPAETFVKDVSPPVRPATPVKWSILDTYEVKGFPLPPRTPEEKPRFMRFKVPIAVVVLWDVNGPCDSGTIKLSRSERTLTVTYRNGAKSSLAPSEGHKWLLSFFGAELGDTLVRTLDV